jgi:amino acid adenylation domain-containing protein/non-ribosomal peptide synthase protein (TIGR01720 family)
VADDSKELLAKALGELRRLKQENKALKSLGGEPIAVVGMACQFPGECTDPEAYWEFLAAGRSAIEPTPPDRAEGTAGGFGSYLKSTDQFDAAFFGISPKEAQSMDPQQRLLLELAWHAFESGHLRADAWAGREVGVFVGMSGIDYALKLFAPSNRAQIDPYFGTGSTQSPAAGRLSYYFKFNGPAMVVDTACSSSLVAIHLAVQSLRRGECEMALAAGVNRILGPDLTLNFEQSGLLAPDGKCYTFDARAEGYSRGEGGGALVLKRLSDAEAAGDTIFALVLGSAVNQDGGSGGLTVPSGPAQQKVIRRALQAAGLTPEDVDYVEAHGTATPLGDPIEVNALGEVFTKGRAAGRPLRVGSVKTNLGHLEAAAGMASSFKVIQSLRREALPPHLNFTEPSPHIDWKNAALRVVDKLEPWGRGERRRVAGVSGFGFVGTNAHIVFAEAPAKVPSPAKDAPPRPELLVLSARTPEALRGQAKAFATRLSELKSTDWQTAAWSARAGRVPFAERLSVVAGKAEEAAAVLRKFAETGKARGAGVGRAAEQVRSAFVFTGQGAQYGGMGRRLYAQHPLFREIVDNCAAQLREPLGRDLRDIMFSETAVTAVDSEASVFDGARNVAPLGELDQTAFTQAGLFVIEYALARVWEAMGVRPEIVVGHSVGEYAAACIAGVFSVEDALKLIAARGRLMERRSAPGAMFTVFADEAVVAKLIAPFAETVAIAAVNGPEIILVSGGTDTIAKVKALCEQAELRVVMMRISHAFHSPLTDPVLAELEAVARTLTLNRPKIPLISNVTGGFVDEEVTDPSYWSRHLRQSVRFCESIALLHAQKLDYFIEVGPEPTLIGLDLAFRAARTDQASTAKWIPSLQRGHDDLHSLFDGAGRLWTAGVNLVWPSIQPDAADHYVPLPGYAFLRKRHWFNFADSVTAPASISAPVPEMPTPATPPVSVSTAPVPVRPNADAVLAEVQAIICEVSGLEPADLSRAANLLEMGLDSLMFVRSGRVLEKRFQVKISIKQFYEDLHRIGALVDFLVANSAVETVAPTPVVVAAAPAAPAAPAPVAAVPAAAPAVAVAAPTMAARPAPVAPMATTGLDPVLEAHFRLMERYLELRTGFAAPAAPATSAAPAAPVTLAPVTAARIVPTPVAAPAAPAPMSGKLAVNFGGLNLEEEKNLSPQQKQFLRALTERLAAKTRRSKEQTQAWRHELADWKGSLQFKRSLKELKYPIVSNRSQGSRIWDVDGNEYVDLALGMGVHFLGHAPAYINEALHRQIDRTAALGPQSDLAGEVAKKICQLTGTERASLAITGSGAVMLAQRLARAAAGRPLIAQFAGAYHGIGSEVLVVGGEEGSRPMSPGIPPSVVQNAQVLDYGSEEALEWIREHAAQLAAVIVEPVQSRRPSFQPHRFLRRLRKLTTELNIILIFDEMINGFRIHGGGAQAWFGIEADLVTYGKIVGGGMPLAVVAGKAKLLDWIDGGFWQFGDDSAPTGRTIFTGGTHNRHPLALAAAGAALDYLIAEGPALHEAVNRKTERLGKELNAFFEEEMVSVRAAWFGSQFRFEALGDAFDLEVLFYSLTELGFYTWEQRICCLSVAHTDEEIDRLIAAVRSAVAAMRAGGFALLAGPRAPRRVLPLSPVQERLFALCQREGAEMPYHLSGVWEMVGQLDLFKLQDAFQEIVRRHESLRTAFGLINGKPSQYVFEEPRFFLEEIKVAGKSPGELLQDFIRPFDLERPPLLRVGCVVLDPNRTLLLIDVHHIAADGLSMNVILSEFAKLYDGQPLGPVKRQYRHACSEAEALKKQPDYRLEEAYWLNEMAGSLPVLDLPGDHVRSGEMDFRGDKCGISIDADRTRRLEMLAREHGASLYMVLLAAYVTLLHRLSGAEDLVVGLPVAGRPGADNDEVVGMFVNSLPLRFRPQADQTFDALLRAVRGTCLGAYDHAAFEFSDLVARLDLPRNPDRNPVFDTMFAYESADDRVMRTRDLTIRTIDQFEGSGMFDLSVDIIRERGVLGIRFHYATRLFNRDTIERYGAAFNRLLDAVLERPQDPIGRLSILMPAELGQVSVNFCSTAGPIAAPTTLVALWTNAAKVHADLIALVCGERRLTYREVDALADAVARRLMGEFGVKRGDRVALLVGASDHMIVAILGVLKAGAAYVPIDVENPADRVRGLLADAGARILIVDTPPEWSAPGVEPVSLATLCRAAVEKSTPLTPPTPDALAYVIYTSGSTGKPKGVMIEHGAITNSILWRIDAYPFAPGDCSLLMPSYAFDASILDIFPVLISGGRLLLVNAVEKRDLAAQAARLQREHVTSLLLTPSLHSLYLDEIATAMSGLKWVCVAGEATTLSLVRRHFERLPGVRLFNEYGPTENSVVTTFTELFPTDTMVSIGRPVAGCQVYVIQPNGEFCGVGVPGELVISGVGLARGYLNQPELTAAAFGSAPWDAERRIYRTGDLARWRSDGALEFLGRRDAQVKLRGYRIELDEIEEVVRRQPGVAAAAVKVASVAGEPQLIAYVTTRHGFDESAVRGACQEVLPIYMVPAVFFRLDAMPLNTSGKVDRKALPVPVSLGNREKGGLARGAREQVLAQVWSDVLRQPNIGRDEDYFQLGGDSIKGIQIISRLLQAGWRLDMRWLFRHPTIAGLAPKLEATRGSADAVAPESVGEVPLGPIQRWFFDRSSISPEHFNQAIWLDARGRWNAEAMQAALRHVVSGHDAFRFRFTREADGWHQQCTPGLGSIVCHVVDWREADRIEQRLAELQQAEQAALNLAQGPVTRAVIVQLATGDRLFWTAHHLVVDGVSWRILLEDLAATYAAEVADQLPPRLLRTVSFGNWTRAVSGAVVNGLLRDEVAYWQELASRPEPKLPRGRARATGTVADLRTVEITLSEDVSQRLLQQAHTPFRTRGNELFIAALRIAYADWNPWQPLELLLEGHGREAALSDLDISRTVGWFTSVHPAYFAPARIGPPDAALIRETKEHLRSVPRNGAGFGWLQATGAALFSPERLRSAISFNFLGAFESGAGAFALSAERPVAVRAGNQPVDHSIAIMGYVAGGRMYWSVEYDSVRWPEITMQGLLGRFIQVLGEVAACTAATPAVVPSPADFVFHRLKLEAFDRMVERREWQPDTIEDIYPLSPMQKGLFYEAIKAPSSEAYFEQMSFCLDGTIDLPAIETSWRDLVARHPALRSVFVHAEGGDDALQVVFRTQDPALSFESLVNQSPEQQQKTVDAFQRADRAVPFELESGPLMRVRIFQLGRDRLQLVWSHHHILMDGWCVGILYEDLMRSYEARAQHRELRWEAPADYRGYLRWLETVDRKAAAAFWRAELAGYDRMISLPRNQAAGAAEYRCGKSKMRLAGPAWAALQNFATQHGATTATLLNTLWGILLSRYNQSEDVVFGGIVSGRPESVPDVEQMVGLFINALPVRLRFSGGMTLREALRQFQAQAIERRPHEYLALAEITEQAGMRELFDHLVVLENYPMDEELRGEGTGKNATVRPRLSQIEGFERTHLDFTLVAVPRAGALEIEMTYNEAVYDAAQMVRVQTHLAHLVGELAARPETACLDVDFLPTEERRMIESWNATAAKYPTDATIHSLFAEQVIRHPQRGAVSAGGKTINYTELDAAARQLAGQLVQAGVRVGDRVAIWLPRGTDLVVSLLATIMAGGCYVPLDPEYPEERLRFIMEDSGARVVVSHSGHRSPFAAGREVCIDTAAAATAIALPVVGPDHPAYIIYTSGSTGKPKGCLISHRNVVRLLRNDRLDFTFGPEDVWVVAHSFCFDFSVWEMYGALTFGGRVVVAPREVVRDVASFVELVGAERVTVLNQTPAAFYAFIAEALKHTTHDFSSHLRYVIFGGDRLEASYLSEWADRYGAERPQLINMYGITETTVHVTFHRVTEAEIRSGDGQSVIGGPLPETQVWVLDRQRRVLPIGMVGELYVGGTGVGMGYLNRPELTAERFLADPNRPGLRLYRTGDIGRWRDDGRLEYLGRNDHQVQVRGFRVELGEVEAACLAQGGIDQAVVLPHEETAGQIELVAYLVGSKRSASEMRTALVARLPHYMVPSYFEWLAKIPLTANGKIDRKALPRPGAGVEATGETAAPRNPTEQTLLTLWREVLGLATIGIHDNFFDLGGQSLKAVRLRAKIESTLNVSVSLRELFARPTIAELAVAITEAGGGEQAAAVSPELAELMAGLSPEEIEAQLRELQF